MSCDLSRSLSFSCVAATAIFTIVGTRVREAISHSPTLEKRLNFVVFFIENVELIRPSDFYQYEFNIFIITGARSIYDER